MINLNLERVVNMPITSLLIGGYSGLIFYLIIKFIKSFIGKFEYLMKTTVSEELSAKILIDSLKQTSIIFLLTIPLLILEVVRAINLD